MKTLTWTLSLIASAILLSGSASAQCTRHFYNNSNYTFKVGILTGLCNNTAICTIRPHSTGTLVYFPLPGGTINISSRIAGGTFGISGCYIYHHGNTGAIAVNSPADGDVTTCGRSGWRCPAPR